MDELDPALPTFDAPDLADAWHALLPQIVERAGPSYVRRVLGWPAERVTFVDALSVYGVGVWFAFVLVNVHGGGETRLIHLPLINELETDVTPGPPGASTTALARVVTGTRIWRLRDAVGNADFRSNLKLLFHSDDREDFWFSAPVGSTSSGFHVVAAPAWSEARLDVLRDVGAVVTHDTEAALIGYGPHVSATLFRVPAASVGFDPRLGQLTYDASGNEFQLVRLSGPDSG